MNGDKIKVLVTGGLGNLGSWVTDHFAAKNGYEVYVLTKNDRQLNIDHGFKKIFCDITDKAALTRSLHGIEIDYLIHLASLNESNLDNYAEQALMINSYGTRNLLEVCSDKKIKKVIYMSTFHVYGKDGGTITEEDMPAPVNDYAITHYFAEEYIKMFCRRQDFSYIIFRLSNSYGCPKDVNTSKWYLLFNDLCRQAVQNKKIGIRTNGSALRDFIHMHDVCIAIENILKKENTRNMIFNLGSGESLSVAAIANLVAKAYKEKYKEEVEIQKNNTDKTKYPAQLQFSVAKLKKEIGFRPSFCYEEEAKKIFEFVDKNQPRQ